MPIAARSMARLAKMRSSTILKRLRAVDCTSTSSMDRIFATGSPPLAMRSSRWMSVLSDLHERYARPIPAGSIRTRSFGKQLADSRALQQAGRWHLAIAEPPKPESHADSVTSIFAASHHPEGTRRRWNCSSVLHTKADYSSVAATTSPE